MYKGPQGVLALCHSREHQTHDGSVTFAHEEPGILSKGFGRGDRERVPRTCSSFRKKVRGLSTATRSTPPKVLGGGWES